MSINIKSKIFFGLLPFALSGCATVFCGSTQVINVKAVDSETDEDLKGARCSVVDDKGSNYAVMSNPGTVTVYKGRGSLRVECHKEGYHYLNTAVGDSFNSVTLVNILFWPGAIVDALTGAYKDFPSHYVVRMEKNPEVKKDPSKS